MMGLVIIQHRNKARHQQPVGDISHDIGDGYHQGKIQQHGSSADGPVDGKQLRDIGGRSCHQEGDGYAGSRSRRHDGCDKGNVSNGADIHQGRNHGDAQKGHEARLSQIILDKGLGNHIEKECGHQHAGYHVFADSHRQLRQGPAHAADKFFKETGLLHLQLDEAASLAPFGLQAFRAPEHLQVGLGVGIDAHMQLIPCKSVGDHTDDHGAHKAGDQIDDGDLLAQKAEGQKQGDGVDHGGAGHKGQGGAQISAAVVHADTEWNGTAAADGNQHPRYRSPEDPCDAGRTDGGLLNLFRL